MALSLVKRRIRKREGEVQLYLANFVETLATNLYKPTQIHNVDYIDSEQINKKLGEIRILPLLQQVELEKLCFWNSLQSKTFDEIWIWALLQQVALERILFNKQFDKEVKAT
ncbi:hypothetical protein CEXT_281981 [Caerostris extrusa]|uniref:Uncharacterized protein n=1 Tax=Caerostris extrusa TaxID=172846 RepID=A0AAV4TS59_CAEEX|nr:hypothetical protein CEXT_281981 [Caerostris extrusa]